MNIDRDVLKNLILDIVIKAGEIRVIAANTESPKAEKLGTIADQLAEDAMIMAEWLVIK